MKHLFNHIMFNIEANSKNQIYLTGEKSKKFSADNCYSNFKECLFFQLNRKNCLPICVNILLQLFQEDLTMPLFKQLS